MTPEFITALSGIYLKGLVGEIATTRKVIAAVPDQHHDYKPDPTSKTAIELAWHLAAVDVWFLDSIASHNFAQGGEGPIPAELKTGADIAAWYDKHVAASLPKVEAMTAEQLGTVVSFFGMFELPAVSYLPFMNGHMIHHRGQLSTYMRAMGGKCPSIYGPSADENPFA